MFEIHLFLHSVNINPIQRMQLCRENTVSFLCSSKNLNFCYEYNSADILKNIKFLKSKYLKVSVCSWLPFISTLSLMSTLTLFFLLFSFPCSSIMIGFPTHHENKTLLMPPHIYWCLHMFPTFFLNCLMLEGGPSLLFWNLSNQLPTCTMRHTTRAKTSTVLQWKPEIWHRTLLFRI